MNRHRKRNGTKRRWSMEIKRMRRSQPRRNKRFRSDAESSQLGGLATSPRTIRICYRLSLFPSKRMWVYFWSSDYSNVLMSKLIHLEQKVFEKTNSRKPLKSSSKDRSNGNDNPTKASKSQWKWYLRLTFSTKFHGDHWFPANPSSRRSDTGSRFIRPANVALCISWASWN